MATKPRAIAILSLIVSMLCLVRPSLAGVVVVTDYPDYKLVEYFEGHREKSVMVPTSEDRNPVEILKGDRADLGEILDLDKRTKIDLDFENRTYREWKYSEDDDSEASDAGMTEVFKPTGKRRKALGFWCDEYRADDDSAKFGKVTSVECISSSPPGAKDYIAFEKFTPFRSPSKSEPVQVAASAGYEPYGFVLWSRYEDWEGIHEGPRISLIKRVELPPSVFEIPPGFVKDRNP